MLHKSIRFRIQFWHSLLLIATTVGLSLTYFHYEKQGQIGNVDSSLQAYSLRVLPAIENHVVETYPDEFARARERGSGGRLMPPPRLNGPNRFLTLEERLDALDLVVYVWSREEKLLFESEKAVKPAPAFRTVMPRPPDIHFSNIGDLRVYALRARFGMFIGFATDISQVHQRLAQLRIKLVLLNLFAIFGGVFGGWYLTGRAIRPIHRISATAQSIADGNRSHRIDLSNTDSELDQLAHILNQTFDKLDHAYEQQVKFTADASHELRTPLAAMLSQIQLALSRERSIEEYQEHFRACQNQATHMRSLLNNLLELARSDSGELEFHRDELQLDELIAERVESLAPLAEAKDVRLETELPPVSAYVDGLRFSQVLTNVISNAIRYSPAGKPVTIKLDSTDGTARIQITDRGPGIPESALPNIFDRFYRASKSRTTTHGNVGLGLAIAKTIVERHRGSIHAQCDADGTTFTIEIPTAA